MSTVAPQEILDGLVARDPGLDDQTLQAYLFSSEFSNDPYPFWAYLRDVRPVWFCEPMNGWFITRFDDVVRVLKDDKLHTTKPYEWMLAQYTGRTLLDMSGREHARKRGLMTPFFHGERLEGVGDLVREASAELARPWAGAGEVELYSQYSKLFPLKVITRLIGVHDEETLDFEALIGWFNAILRQTANLTGDKRMHEDALEARRRFTEFMLPIIEKRREAPRDDLLSFLIAAEIDGVRLTTEEIRASCHLVLSAGWETTDKLILGVMTNLLSTPDALERVTADRTLVTKAVAETLRRDAVSQFLARELTQEVELHGQVIPQGAFLIPSIGSANRDERAFADPDRFDLDRTDLDGKRAFTAGGRQVAFGIGRHFCLGAQLGRVEAVTATNHLLDVMGQPRFKGGVTPRWEGLFARGEGALESMFRSVRKLEVEFEPTGAAL